ncbi:hypothetical protein EDB85DRAFT_1936828, partial [Lactarius pseudohatsudake]
KYCVPLITTLTLFTSPQTTSNVWVIVIRPSSWVRRSSLRRTDSISHSPNSFLANLSAQPRASTERNSTIIFTLISVMGGVKGRSV